MSGRKRLTVQADSATARLLEMASGASLLVEIDGALYRVERLARDSTSDIGALTCDPETARAALRASAGALIDVDRDRLLTEIQAQRGQKNAGRPAE